MLIETRGGPAVLTDGSFSPVRSDRTGAAVVTDAHGRYMEAAFRGNVFHAANPPATSSAALNTTYTGGVCVNNPAGNTKNLVIMKVSGVLVVITAAVTGIGIAVGWAQAGVVTHTTPLTPTNGLVGTGPLPTGKADQACTLVGTPTYLAMLGTTAQAVGDAFGQVDLEGSIVIPPGGYICTFTSIASPAAGFQGSISWEEVTI